MISNEKNTTRFFTCYKIQIDNELKKKIYVITAINEIEAIIKLSNIKNIPNKKIGRDDNTEGWIYCNEIYNPLYTNVINENKNDET